MNTKGFTKELLRFSLGFFIPVLFICLFISLFQPSINNVGAAAITAITPVGPYPTSVSAGDLTITWASATTTSASNPQDYDNYTATGKQLILVRNHGIEIYGVTFDTVAGTNNREADIENYLIDPNEIVGFWVGGIVGWKNATGNVRIQASSTYIEYAIITIPG